MARILVFGGPALPEGSHTWYETLREDGVPVQLNAYPGDQVPEDQVCKSVAGPDGTVQLAPNAEYFVTAGMASWIEDRESIGH